MAKADTEAKKSGGASSDAAKAPAASSDMKK
jgi:hypothetical protein